MLRSIGLVTGLALLLVACGGGGGPPPAFTVSGAVSGLVGTGLVLRDNGGDDLPVAADGAIAFPTKIASGATYSVTVFTQPTSPAQTCAVTYGSGTMGSSDVIFVVSCTGYTVGGTVSGLVGSGLTLAICHPIYVDHPHGCPSHSELQIGANGAFTLDSNYPAGYSGGDVVFIAQQPSSPPQNCVISNAAVSIHSANDTSVTVSCAEYSYVTNAADNTLSSYSIDPTTGALAVVGTPIATGASPHAIVGVDYGGGKRFVFVGNEGSNDVSAFAVNPATGALTAVPGSPFPAGTDPQAMAFSFDASSLYVVNAGSDNLFAYDIDVNTGALTGPSATATGKNPTSIIRSYGFIFVTNHGGSNDISEYYSPPTALGPPFPAGGNPLSLALGTGGKFLYTANPDATNPSISGFSIDISTGAVSPLSGSPFPLPVSHYIATDQMGTYLYVTSGANVVGYAIDATTGALTALPGFPVTVGVDAYSITIDPTNRFLYVTDDGAAHVSGFTLDASTGALTPMSGSPFPAGHHPQFIATF